ncbi:transcription initiation factor IIB-like [Oryza brachyantha]|uniref:TFIIB-type domain-containing protein n=1 Tax=Oryza brachyantha TaxID=4533 RepID=J3ML58_ORYBR|nr:transcription initiation factor IIB-like [Oryza brachyantha]
MYGCADVVRYCQGCQRDTSMVLDHATGDAVCIDCVLVLGGAGADACSQPRWRAGSARDSVKGGEEVVAAADADGGAIALPVTPPADAGSAAPSKTTRAAAVPKMRGALPDMSKVLAEGFDAIASMARRLWLPDVVSYRAKEVLRKLEEARAWPKGRGSRDALYAACLHTACRAEGSPRTLKELAAVTPDSAATKRDIGRFINAIKRHHLGQQEEASRDHVDTRSGGGVVVRAGDYLLRYGEAVGMSDHEVAAARSAARRLDESLDVRRNPQSIAAAIIYMAVQRSGDGRGKSVREVSAATGVSESTIKDAHRDLCPHAALLFP